MGFIIRIANEQDYPAIVALIKEFAVFQGAPEKVLVTAEQMRADQSIFQCMVAEGADKTLIGFATCFFAYYSWTGKALYLDDLYVKEKFRNMGIGKTLLTAIIDYATEQGCKKVRWQVSKWNANAIAFYKSRGATVDETEINCEYMIGASRDECIYTAVP